MNLGARTKRYVARAKRVLGIDIARAKYAYAHDPRFGHISESRVADSWVKTTCGYCSVGCGMLIGVKNGSAVAARGNPDHPVNRGKLCPKGLSEHHMLTAPGRATTPLLRKEGVLTPVTWDEAISTMVTRIPSIQARHGRELYPGWTTTHDAYKEWQRVSAGRACDYSAISWEQIEREGGVQWGGERLYSDGLFAFEGGRARLHSVPCEPFAEQPDRDYNFILNTGRTVEHWHTRTKTGAIAMLNGMVPNAWLEMNPIDAAQLNLRSHERVTGHLTSQPRRAGRVPHHRYRCAGAGLHAVPFSRGELKSRYARCI